MQKWFTASLLALFAAALALRLILGTPRADSDLTREELRAYRTLREIISSQYAEEVKPRDLFFGAMKGMAGSLDHYSEFLTPDEFREMKHETEGQFGGLGIEVYVDQSGRMVVHTPLIGTPAAKAGIKPGDVILRILTSRGGREEWVDTGELALFEAVGLLKGPPGTAVSIEIISKGDEAPRQITIERARIDVPSVLFALILPRPGGIGYLDLASFQEKTGLEFKAAVDGLLAQGMKGLIIDLRYNPGGTLGSSVEVADLLLEKGTIVSVRGRNPTFTESYSAKKDGTYPPFPIVVLIEGTSASAAEIVAAALHDNRRATLVGERTFGKGSVQSIIPLNLGAAYGEGGLRLTCARYYTPSGVCIHREPDSKQWGIAPDVEVKLADDEKRKLWDARSKAWIDRNAAGSASATAYPDDSQVEAACKRLDEQLAPAGLSPAASAGTSAP